MAAYELLPEAEDDLYRIWIYGAEKFGDAQADKFFTAFFQMFELIGEDPYIYPSVEHIRPGYRRAVSGAESIYYRIVEHTVEIMAVVGRQNIYDKL